MKDNRLQEMRKRLVPVIIAKAADRSAIYEASTTMTTRSIFARNAMLASGWTDNVRISITDAAISAVEVEAAPLPDDTVVDFIIPGLGNLHSHAFQRAFSGLTEARGTPSDTFWTWRKVMYRYALGITPDELHAVAAQLYMEMLEAGFCRVGEFHYLHHDADGRHYDNIAELAERLCAASAEAGISMTLLPSFYAHGNFGGAAPTAGQARFINSLDTFGKLMEASRDIVARLDGGRIGVAPHSLRAVTPAELHQVVQMASDGPIHIHISEQTKEVEDCLSWSGKRPVEWLLENAELDDRWCLIHATHINDAELVDIARSGATVGLCPITEGNLGDGIFPGQSFLSSGGSFGIGSDSNVRISAAQELAQLEYSQRLVLRNRNVLAESSGSTGQAIFGRAATGAGRVLQGAGLINVGLEASLISFDQRNAEWIDADTLFDSWIFGMDQRPDKVWVRGRLLVDAGVHIERDRIRTRFASVMKRLKDRL